MARLASKLGPPRANLYHYSQAYQPRHGIARTLEPLVRDVSGELHLGSPVTAMETRGGRVVRVVAGEQEFTPDVVVSTIPLTTLGRVLSGHGAFASLARLEYRHVGFFLCRVKADRFRPSMLAYVPDPRYSFYRIGIPKSYWEEHCAAEEVVVCAEVAMRDDEDLPAAVAAIEDRVVDEICAFYAFPRAAVLGVDTALQRNAYPVMSAAEEGLFLGLGHETALENLYLTGRTGQFKYWLIEECLNAADACAERILERHGGGEPARTR